MLTTACLECDNEIRVSIDNDAGDRIICSHCGAEFEIVSLNPLEIDWPADEIDDNWDDDLWDGDEVDEEEDEWDDEEEVGWDEEASADDLKSAS